MTPTPSRRVRRESVRFCGSVTAAARHRKTVGLCGTELDYFKIGGDGKPTRSICCARTAARLAYSIVS